MKQREVQEPYEVQLSDVMWWEDNSPREYFTQAHNLARRALGVKNIKPEHIERFKKEYRMMWNFDNTFEVFKRAA